MRGRIPADVIDKIREDTAIEDVVGHFLSLQRKGDSLWACCPFHHEKTPSFHVHPGRQIYYCFGCQRGGNVFRFLMEKEGMGFRESVEFCAERLGVDLSKYLSASSDEEGPDPREALLRANQFAQEWFVEQLRGSSGRDAREYARRRGLAPETIESFGLGWAPPNGHALLEAAQRAKLDPQALVDATLLRVTDDRDPFAYFRSRLIFPVRGVSQKIHGFGGRILGPGEPKYLNSPETPVFRKRRTLYALPEARAAMTRAKSAILVEGYLDALALHQAGWTHTVATCGTAFTPEQAQQLRRWVTELILVFDGDAAGRKAAYRSAGVAMAAGLEVRIVRLPQGHDPADLLAAGEGETVQRALREAPGLVECMKLEVDERGGSRAYSQRALDFIREIAGGLQDPVRSELLLKEAAQIFGVSVQALGQTVKTRSSVAPTPQGKNDHPPGPSRETSHGERRLLIHALTSRAARRRLFQQWPPERFADEQFAEIARRIAALGDQVDAVTRVDQLVDISGHEEPMDDSDAANETEALDSRVLEGIVAGMLASEQYNVAIQDGYDAVAAIVDLIDTEDRRIRRAQSKVERKQLDEEYRSGDRAWLEKLGRRQESPDDPDQPHRPTDPS
jgi:DNA primase